MRSTFWRFVVMAIVLFLMVGETAGADSGEIISSSFSLSIQNHRLTAKIDQVPLRTVLEALTDQMPITITLKGFEGENSISATFTNLPLEEGIEQLLYGQEYALLYARSDSVSRSSGQARLVEIVVLPRQNRTSNTASHETQLVLVPRNPHQTEPRDNDQSFFDRLERQAFESSDPADRVAAIATIAEQQEDQALSVLSRASRDQDPEVRATAIVLLATQEETGSANLLKEALQDSNPDIRELAEGLLQGLEVPRK